MIEQLLPDSVACVWTTRDSVKAALLPAEEGCLRHAVDERRREFTTGRHCARQALAGLGLPGRAIPAGPRGEPLWPAGVVGSITHCRGYRAAAVARSAQVPLLGIDAEEHRALPPELLPRVLLPAERAAVARLARLAPQTHWPTVLFSAKEAVYKAWYPLTGRWLGFHDARLEVSLDGHFRAVLLVDPPRLESAPVREFQGRWTATGETIATAAFRVA
ncbi:4'-phosphopantetheinyl transferase superfamily protein [Kitasatospora sp. NBC_01287]|uniref:4'-phosphopantetheinyl transferase family protein n=1 Tax=Kitasatospora sp. NBC_01287 TaxID=2903573 RepID=UPI00224CC979|nr:4'-phosphopantetheinyl transferase superfamily protein [Kitasatospora sp. NBC_01287]MCX4746054.1 4'-phosphopantetheinyl transferase superfamily protein [Kitasatospora sp. NBC_01287]